MTDNGYGAAAPTALTGNKAQLCFRKAMRPSITPNYGNNALDIPLNDHANYTVLARTKANSTYTEDQSGSAWGTQ